MMQKITTFVGLLFFSLSISFAQPQSGRFWKKIEDNYRSQNRVILPDGREEGEYNIDGKQRIDRRFFGDFNAKVEYFFDPSFSPAQGLRIYRDSLDRSYLLEVKQVVDYNKVNKQVELEYPLLNNDYFYLITLPDERQKDILQYNSATMTKQWNEQAKRYQIGSVVLSISDEFAETIYAKTCTMIDTFKATGKPAMIGDGYQATFRTVVDFELWTFTIHEPRGRVEELSNLFREIIVDVQADCFDQTKYLNRLGD